MSEGAVKGGLKIIEYLYVTEHIQSRVVFNNFIQVLFINTRLRII